MPPTACYYIKMVGQSNYNASPLSYSNRLYFCTFDFHRELLYYIGRLTIVANCAIALNVGSVIIGTCDLKRSTYFRLFLIFIENFTIITDKLYSMAQKRVFIVGWATL